MSVLVVSPHFDDAVLSIGQVIDGLDGVAVATVFGGVPGSHTVLTAYDSKCGFGSSEGAMYERRLEDHRALTLLTASQLVGGWLDGQYGVDTPRAEIRRWIEKLAPSFEHVLVPLGVQHPDHQVVGAECRSATILHGSVWVYEELPYRVQFPEVVSASLESLRRDGWTLELNDPFERGPLDHKVAAIHCYQSQVSPEMVRWSQVPERLWHLTRKDVSYE